MAFRAVVASLLLAPTAAFRSASNSGQLAVDTQTGMATAELVAAATERAEQEHVKDALSDGGKWFSTCPCWNPLTFYSLMVDQCCVRTDKGTSNLKAGENKTCAAQPSIMGVADPAGACGSFCEKNCWRVLSKGDKAVGWMDALAKKIMDVSSRGFADGLLDKALSQANKLATGAQQDFLKVSSVHALHPVGTWNQEVADKIAAQKQAVLAVKDLLKSKGLKLSVNDTKTQAALKPLQSDSPFLAVAFPFCGFDYVVLDGNTRLKGLQAAAAADPELAGLAVEVSVLQFTPTSLTVMQQAFALLWNQYTKDVYGFDPVKEAAKVAEYNTFRINVAKCVGVNQGWFKGYGPCPVVDKDGKQVDSVQPGAMFGSDGTKITGPNWDFKQCGKGTYVRASAPGAVVEFCPNCVERS